MDNSNILFKTFKSTIAMIIVHELHDVIQVTSIYKLSRNVILRPSYLK